MKKFTKVFDKINGGGVLALSAILALSLIFASCANSSDSDDDNNTVITDNNNNNGNNNNSDNSNSGDNNSNNSNSNGNNSNNNSSNGNNGNVNSGNNNNDANNNNSNGGNNNNDNPSPTLPVSVGKNPITETVKLSRDNSDDSYLELKSDGTALTIYINNDKNNAEETECKYKYTYDDEKKTITMKLEKYYYGGFFGEEEIQLLTYDELCSKIDKEFTVEKFRESEKEYYEERKDDERFKEDYPDCNSYEDYEAAFVKENGFASFADAVEYEKQIYKNNYKAIFGAQITYAYKIDDGKITLTEKFTGVKNMVDSECYFRDESGYCYIYSFGASIRFIEDDSRYSGTIDTDENTISFESEGRKEKITATYTENINAETVTIKFKDNEYVCKFKGKIFIQE